MGIFQLMRSIWVLLFGWMPIGLAVFCTVLLAVIAIIIIIKIIAFILDAIPFL